MADSEVIGIDIVARIDQFRNELKKIEAAGGDAGKGIAAELNASIKSMEREIKKAGSAARNTGKQVNDSAKGWKDLADKAGDTEAAFIGIGDILNLLVPGISDATTAMADLGGGLEGVIKGSEGVGVGAGRVLAVLGPLALAAAAAGVAYNNYAKEAARAAAVNETYRSTNTALLPTIRAVADAQIDLALATGQINEAEAQRQKTLLGAQRGTLDFAASLEEQRRALREQQISLQNKIGTTAIFGVGQIGLVGSALFDWKEDLAAVESQLQILDQAIQKEATNQKTLRTLTQQTADTEQAKAAATSAASQSSEMAAAAQARYQESLQASQAALEEASALQEQFNAGVASLEEITQSTTTAQLDGAAKILATSQEKLDALEAEYQALVQVAQGNAQLLAAADAYESARVALVADSNQQIRDLNQAAMDQQLADQAAALERSREASRAVSDQVVGDLATISSSLSQTLADQAAALSTRLEEEADSLTASQRAELERRTEDAKKAALVAFKISQAAAIAQATVTAALAALEAYQAALALGPAGLFIAPVAAGAAAAVGATQIAAIAATPPPVAHTGMAPDELMIRAKSGEGILSRQGVAAAGGADAVRRLNSGQGGAPQVLVVEQVYGHRVFDRFVADHLKADNTLSRRTRSGKSGHLPTRSD